MKLTQGSLSVTWRKAMFSAILASLLGAVGIATPPAARAAEPEARPAVSGQLLNTRRCQTVVAKLQPGEATSRIVSQDCAEPGEALPALSDTTRVLLVAFDEAGYKGLSNTYYGYEGACDPQGYGIADVGWAMDGKISSFDAHNNCVYVNGYTDTNYGGECGEWYWSQSYVGDHFNDRLRSFRVRSAYYPCR